MTENQPKQKQPSEMTKEELVARVAELEASRVEILNEAKQKIELLLIQRECVDDFLARVLKKTQT